MITGIDAIQKSLLKYCYNNEFCIATGDGTNFTKYFLGESVPFFDVNDTTYWLIDKSLKPLPVPKESEGTPISSTPTNVVNEPNPIHSPAIGGEPVQVNKNLKSVTISGKVPFEQYTQLFASFIMPLAHNNIEIEIKIKGKSTQAKPISENSQEYKIIKESAKQLGLNFDEE